MGGQVGRPVRTAGRLVVRTGTVLSVVGGSLVVASAPASAATTLTVTNTADSGPGSLRAAVDAAVDGDTIVFDLDAGETDIALTSQLVIDSAVDIQGPGSSALAVHGGAGNRVFYVYDSTPGTVSISGLTIADGDVSTNGGGVLVIDGTHLVLDGVDVSGNQADALGGGVAAIDASLDLRNSTVSGNTASGGGGLGVGGGSGVSIAATTFTANTADTTAPGPDGVSGLGGGAFLSYVDGEVSVTGSGFFGNQAAKYGGLGLSDITGTVTIAGTDIGAADPGAGNQAYLAGGLGLAHIAGDLTVSDSSISGNTAEYGGGGFKYSDATIGDVAYIEANDRRPAPGICVLRHPDDPAHHRHGQRRPRRRRHQCQVRGARAHRPEVRRYHPGRNDHPPGRVRSLHRVGHDRLRKRHPVRWRDVRHLRRRWREVLRPHRRVGRPRPWRHHIRTLHRVRQHGSGWRRGGGQVRGGLRRCQHDLGEPGRRHRQRWLGRGSGSVRLQPLGDQQHDLGQHLVRCRRRHPGLPGMGRATSPPTWLGTELTIRHSTIASNQASELRGGIAVVSDA